MDNCSGVYNSPQLNTDGNYIDNSPPYAPATDDKTWANSDAAGDACDPDDDNDGLTDVNEESELGCGSVAITDPLLRDTDGDRFLDNAECAVGTDPTSAPRSRCSRTARRRATRTGTRSRTGSSSASTTATPTPSTRTATQLDGAKDGCDRLHQRRPHRLLDRPGDAARRCEIASLNGDRIVSSIDQGMLVGHHRRRPYTANVDINKDGVLSSIDQGIMASFIVPSGQCP